MSSTTLIERSWPTASGVSASGKVTASRPGSTRSASASDRQLAPGDLDGDVGQLDAGQVDLDDRPLRLAAVVDVDARREAAAAAAGVGRPPPGVTQQLVHLPSHAGEIREQVAFRHQSE